jgi:hypothetical protein
MCAVTWINAAKMDTCLSKIFKKVVMNSSWWMLPARDPFVLTNC